ncbi:MAG: RimJ/RimL family protein N-acetyltransferase [Patescibacteria group bacterium]|jgi:RimJ/RimL family protein N-acetyltransferase
MAELQTKRLTIRELNKKDTPLLAQNLNNLDISENLSVVGHPYTLKDAKTYVKFTVKFQKQKPRTLYELAIAKKESPQTLIGAIALSNINYFDSTASIGYWLAINEHRKGYMSEALHEIIKFAFQDLKLRRINIFAFTSNKASNALIKKVGFTYEGIRKEYTRVNSTGKIVDGYFYGLLKKDWEKISKKRSL